MCPRALAWVRVCASNAEAQQKGAAESSVMCRVELQTCAITGEPCAGELCAGEPCWRGRNLRGRNRGSAQRSASVRPAFGERSAGVRPARGRVLLH